MTNGIDMNSLSHILNLRQWRLIVLFTALIGCRDLDVPLTNELNNDAFWRNDQDALDALASCYQFIIPNWDNYFGNEALSDNAFNRGTSYGGAAQIANGSYDNRTNRITAEWANQYNAIRRCNVVLENVDKIQGSTVEKIARYKSEARFIRAWAHFQLASYYGDVPLIDRTITVSESQTITRTAKADVVAFIVQELEEIQADLPVTYPVSETGRITKAAAIALRARVNLYEENWAAVVSDCEKLINSTTNGTFVLYPEYAGLFSVDAENSNEIIFALQMGGARLQANQRLFLPQTVGRLRSELVPTKALVDDYVMTNGRAIAEVGSGYDDANPFTNRDPRLDKTILREGSTIIDFNGATQTILTAEGSDPATNSITDQGASATGYYFRKYYDPTAVEFNSGLNLILIRYADVLLMYAEAKNELNAFNATVWNQTIKPIRQRAGFSLASAVDFDAAANQASLRAIIRRERRSELAFEGTRIFDIRRWAIAETVLNQPVKGIKVSNQFNRDDQGNLIVEQRIFTAPKHYLWPVPQSEIDQNANLNPANPGW
jgi:starch-binding outer membrane protein, SusD/RagB family